MSTISKFISRPKAMLAAASLIVLASCSGSILAPQMNTIESSNLLVEKAKLVESTYTIMSATVSETKAMSNEVGFVTLSLADAEGKPYTQSFQILDKVTSATMTNVPDDYEKPKTSIGRSYNMETAKGINAADLNAENIKLQLDKAIALVPEGYSYGSLALYIVNTDKNTGALTYTVMVNVTDDKGSTSVGSRGVSTEYYQLTINIDAAGEAVLQGN